MTNHDDIPAVHQPATIGLRPSLVAVALAILAGALYFNVLGAPFTFDDWLFAAEDGVIRMKWNSNEARHWNRAFGTWTLKTNYEFSGQKPWSYRVFNIAVHALAAITLFGLCRRTLKLPGIAPWLAMRADGLAAAIALVWLVHPLQTQSVTYIVQRYESLMGLFLLLTLYFVVRGAESKQPRDWYIAAWAACLWGAACKEIMALCPLAVLLFDRAFLAGTFGEALRRRKWLYLALLVPVLYLGVVTRHAFVGGEQAVSAGFAMQAVTPWEYLRSQPGVLLHYLWLAFWPDRLIIDYGWPIADSPWEIYGLGAVIVALLSLCVWATWKCPRLGWLGMAFFLILAPTSSIVPIKDLAFEHRMYLPLAAVVALVVLAAAAAVARLRLSPKVERVMALGALATIALALSIRTAIRNNDNHPIRLWSQCIEFNPDNPRPYRILADIYQADESTAALEFYHKALALNPNLYWIWIDLGNFHLRRGRIAEAIPYYERAVPMLPKEETAYVNISRCRMRAGDFAGAAAICREALAQIPGDPVLTKQLAWLLATADDAQVRDGREALEMLVKLPQDPKRVDIQYLEVLSAAQAEAGEFDRAIATAERTVAEARKVRSRRLAEFEARLRQYQAHEPHRTKVEEPDGIAGLL